MITANFAYCPNCGHNFCEPNIFPIHCPKCTAAYYQNSKPTASVLIIKNESVLLSVRKGEPAKGEYDTPGGFLEIGELPENGAIREANEEMGVEVKITKFFGFYITSYLPGIKTLDCFFLANIISGEPQANDDAERLEWYPIGDIPKLKMTQEGPRSALNKLHRLWLADPSSLT